jgi:hypothetical protein
MEISSGKDYEKIPLLGSANLWGDYPRTGVDTRVGKSVVPLFIACFMPPNTLRRLASG